jgi:hypothetical protein
MNQFSKPIPFEKQLAPLVTAMAENFGFKLTAVTLNTYAMGLEDIDIVDVARAIKRAIRELRFMPKVVELREMCGVLSPAARAIKAWKILGDAVAIHGYYKTVHFDDAILNAAIRNLGGWMFVCDEAAKPLEQWEVWFRKKFEQVYASLVQSGVGIEEAKPLPGYFDATNGIEHKRQKIIEIETGLPKIEPRRIASSQNSSTPANLPFLKTVNDT